MVWGAWGLQDAAASVRSAPRRSITDFVRAMVGFVATRSVVASWGAWFKVATASSDDGRLHLQVHVAPHLAPPHIRGAPQRDQKKKSTHASPEPDSNPITKTTGRAITTSPSTMRRLPRLQPLRAIAQPAATPTPFRALSTTRASPFRSTAARRSDDKQRQEVLEALERDRQSALSLQSEAEILEEGEEAEIGGGIVIPPEFSYAPAPGAAGDYVPAKVAEGLEEVGGLEGWWDVEGHLSDADRLRVFSERGEKVMDPGMLEVLIRQAVVEALVVQGKVGGEMLTARWGPSGKEALSRAAGVEVVVSEAGDVTLTGDLSGVLAGLKESAEAEPAQEAAPEAEAAAEGAPEEAAAEQAEELLTAEEAKEMVKSWDRAWRKVPLTDPSLKFAVRTPFPPTSFPTPRPSTN